MAGERTLNIVAQVKDILKDHEAVKFSNDVLIYNYINHYQQDWAINYRTSKRFYTIELASNVLSYNLHPRIFSILSFSSDTENEYDYEGKYNESGNSITLDEGSSITTGDKLIVEAFIRPVFGVSYLSGIEGEQSVTINDKIVSGVDPIIETEYDFYLAQAVCSNYSTKNNPLRQIESIQNDVKRLADHLARICRWTTGMHATDIITAYSRIIP